MSIPSNLGSLQSLLTAARPTSVELLRTSRRSSAAARAAGPPATVEARRTLQPGSRSEDAVIVHLSQAARQASSRQASAPERTGKPGTGPEVTYATSNPEHAAPQPGSDSTETASGAEGTPSGQDGARSAPDSAVPRQTEADQQETRELESRDREVRQHEAAHKNALGQYAKGGATFSFTTGPDGQRYAVGGEVSVDLSEVPGDPDATIRKMTTIRGASLAPQDPSAADRAVAAEAGRILARARQEAHAERGLSDPYPLRGQLLDIKA